MVEISEFSARDFFLATILFNQDATGVHLYLGAGNLRPKVSAPEELEALNSPTGLLILFHKLYSTPNCLLPLSCTECFHHYSQQWLMTTTGAPQTSLRKPIKRNVKSNCLTVYFQPKDGLE